MLDRDWTCSVHHLLHEGNKRADVLAKMGANSGIKWLLLQNPPEDFKPHLHADAIGMSFVKIYVFFIMILI